MGGNALRTRTWDQYVFEEYINTMARRGMLTKDIVPWKQYVPVDIEKEEDDDPDADLFE